MIRFIAKDCNGVPRAYGEGETNDLAETRAMSVVASKYWPHRRDLYPFTYEREKQPE